MRYFLLIIFLILSLFADRGLQLKKMAEEQRLALVVGNNTYQSLSNLKNPINDAKAMRDALQSRNFEVIYLENATQKQFDKQVKKFTTRLKNGDGVGLFYYAGHGIAVDGDNYLVATDSDISDKDEVKYEAIALNEITDRMRHANNRVNIIILDACRNDPFSRSGGGGLAPLRNARGMFVAYATEAGAVAQDGKGKNGIFTKYLIQHLDEPVKIEEVFKRTRRDVATQSNHKQFPGVYNQLYGDFYFTLPNKKQIAKKSSHTFEQNSEKYSLHVKTEPSDATVYITNIKPKYRDGMMLKPGNYDIKVVYNGYKSKTGSVALYSDLNVKVILQEEFKSSSKSFDVTPSLHVKKTKKKGYIATGIFVDSDTGLMWQDNSDAKTVDKNWNRAIAYCSDLSLAGYSDWYLPRKEELESIVDKSRKNTIKNGFKNVSSSYSSHSYWSSTTRDSHPDRAWIVSFYYGGSSSTYKTYNYYVRCVRRGQ